jgi:hypothetical protein
VFYANRVRLEHGDEGRCGSGAPGGGDAAEVDGSAAGGCKRAPDGPAAGEGTTPAPAGPILGAVQRVHSSLDGKRGPPTARTARCG